MMPTRGRSNNAGSGYLTCPRGAGVVFKEDKIHLLEPRILIAVVAAAKKREKGGGLSALHALLICALSVRTSYVATYVDTYVASTTCYY